MSIRSFIALPVSKDTANYLGDLSAKMSYQDKSNAVRWVPQENYHVTIAFLDHQEWADLENLANILDDTIIQPEFKINLSYLSPFPESRPKLLAAMVEKSNELVDLHSQVVSAIRSSGIQTDKRKFKPHITLGRYRHSKNTFSGAIANFIPREELVEEIIMYESILSSDGAEYEPLLRLPLDLPGAD